MDASLAIDIAEALRSNTAALSIFEALPPSRKREYVNWVTSAVGRSSRLPADRTERQTNEAKREDPRRRRIAGMIDRLMGSPERLTEWTDSRPRRQSVGQKTGSPERLIERTGSGPSGQSVGQK